MPNNLDDLYNQVTGGSQGAVPVVKTPEISFDPSRLKPPEDTGGAMLPWIIRLLGSVGAGVAQTADVVTAGGFGVPEALGGALAGGSEALAQKAEGRPNLNWKRIGTEATLGAVPLGWMMRPGKPVISAIKGAAVMGAGEAGRELSEGQDLNLPAIGKSALIAGGIGGALSRMGMTKAPTPATTGEPINTVGGLRIAMAEKAQTKTPFSPEEHATVYNTLSRQPEGPLARNIGWQPQRIHISPTQDVPAASILDVEKAHAEAMPGVIKEKVAEAKAQAGYQKETAEKEAKNLNDKEKWASKQAEEIDKDIETQASQAEISRLKGIATEPSPITLTHKVAAPAENGVGTETAVQKFTEPEEETLQGIGESKIIKGDLSKVTDYAKSLQDHYGDGVNVGISKGKGGYTVTVDEVLPTVIKPKVDLGANPIEAKPGAEAPGKPEAQGKPEPPIKSRTRRVSSRPAPPPLKTLDPVTAKYQQLRAEGMGHVEAWEAAKASSPKKAGEPPEPAEGVGGVPNPNPTNKPPFGSPESGDMVTKDELGTRIVSHRTGVTTFIPKEPPPEGLTPPESAAPKPAPKPGPKTPSSGSAKIQETSTGAGQQEALPGGAAPSIAEKLPPKVAPEVPNPEAPNPPVEKQAAPGALPPKTPGKKAPKAGPKAAPPKPPVEPVPNPEVVPTQPEPKTTASAPEPEPPSIIPFRSIKKSPREASAIRYVLAKQGAKAGLVPEGTRAALGAEAARLNNADHGPVFEPIKPVGVKAGEVTPKPTPKPTPEIPKPPTDTLKQTEAMRAKAAEKRAAVRAEKEVESVEGEARNEEQTKTLEEDLADIQAMPPEERAAFFKRFKGSKGEIDPVLLAKLGIPLTTAGVGSIVDEDHPLRGALIGGLIGAGGIAGATHLAENPDTFNNLRDKGTKLTRELPQLNRFNLLMNPANLATNSLPAPYAGAFWKLLEQSDPGVRNAGLAKLANIPEYLHNYGGNLFKVRELSGQFERGEQLAGSGASYTDKVLSGPGTLMAAGDMTSRDLLESVGVSPAAARDATLTNEPKQVWGKGLMNLLRTTSDDGRRSLFTQLALPFARTTINVIESGLERTPVIGFLAQIGKDPAIVESIPQQLRMQGIGSGVMAGAYAFGRWVAPETAKQYKLPMLMSNLGGQYGLIAAAAFAAGQAQQLGKPPVWTGVQQALQTMPLPTLGGLTDAGKSISNMMSGEPAHPNAEYPPQRYLPNMLLPYYLRDTGINSLQEKVDALQDITFNPDALQ